MEAPTIDTRRANRAFVKTPVIGDESNIASSAGNSLPFIFIFNPRSDTWKGDETEVKIKFSTENTTITVSQNAKPDTVENDDVIKMLESWLHEEPTEEDKKLWEQLESDLQNEQISFSEINME